MNPTSDISNNTPPTDEPTTDIQDIDVSLNVNNNNDTIDNTIDKIGENNQDKIIPVTPPT